MALASPLNARYIGECIYCGARSTPLSREHAVPYFLNGPWTLLQASCAICAQITSRFEKDVARSLWPHIRNVLAMQSRRPGKRTQTLPLVLERVGIREIVQIPKEEYPLYLPTPLFAQPAVFWRKQAVRGVFANLSIIHIAGPTFEDVGAWQE